jgi:hypothetical protein
MNINTKENNDLILVKTKIHKCSETPGGFELLSLCQIDGDGKIVNKFVPEYKYDVHGNEIEMRLGNRISLSTYDSRNRCVKTEHYKSGVLSNVVVFDHGEEERHKYSKSYTSRKADGRLEHKSVTEYTDGRKTNESIYKGNGHLAWTAEFVYDDAGRLTEKNHFKRGILFYKILRTYNSELITIKKYMSREFHDKWNGAQEIDFLLWLCNGY